MATFSIFQTGNRSLFVPPCFGTAKVLTFFAAASFILFFVSAFKKSASSFAGCKGTQIFRLYKDLLKK